MAQEKRIIPVVVGVLVKEVQNTFQIMTQKRKVLNATYDPLYNNTWETVGESLNQGEDCISALLRGIEEECGRKVPITSVLGNSAFWTTQKEDRIQFSQPFCFLQSIREPQLWFGPAYIVNVPKDWEADPANSDGEASDCKWWDPVKLLAATSQTPEKFMGFHLPALAKAAELIIDKSRKLV